MGHALKTSELPRSKNQEISHKVSIFWISLAKPTSGHIPGGIFSGAALVWRGMAWLGVRGGGGAWHGDMAWGAWWAGAWQGMTGRGGVWWGRVQWEARLSRVCLCGLGAPCTWPTLLTYHTYLVPVDP